MDPNLQDLPANLNHWFESVAKLTENSVFRVAPDVAHQDAVVLDTLMRNARIIYQAELDHEGKLYAPVCFFLAAACRQLKTRLGVGHWQAALDNVLDLHKRLAPSQADSEDVGLDTGTPATLFKAEFDEAVRQGGLIDGTSFLSKADRQVALGLAINWGMRLLLSYALEFSLPRGAPDARIWLGLRNRFAPRKQRDGERHCDLRRDGRFGCAKPSILIRAPSSLY